MVVILWLVMVDFMEEKPQFMPEYLQLFHAITSKTTDIINVNNMTNYAFHIGDFIQVDDEIMRIKRTVTRVTGDTELRVFRGVYGSIADTHVVGSVITRVRFYPIEFRRNSIIRHLVILLNILDMDLVIILPRFQVNKQNN